MDKKRFLEIDGLEVEVTEEVYKEYMRPIWREEKRVQRLYKDFIIPMNYIQNQGH